MSRTITRPLSELDQVDWASLNHAYGSAEDVPDQLRAIATDDHEALDYLCHNLWHQGTIYPASATAVPFLIDLLEKGNTDLLWFLDFLAKGSGYLYDSPTAIAEPTYQAELAAEAPWVKDTHHAVAAGAEIYRSFLKNSNLDVVINTVQLLSHIQSIEPKVEDWLWESLQQSESLSVKTECAYALQQARKANPERIKVLKDLFTQVTNDEDSQLAQFAAALALVHQKDRQLALPIRDFLLKSLMSNEFSELTLKRSCFYFEKDIKSAAIVLNQSDVFADAFWKKYLEIQDISFALYALDLIHPTPETPLSPLAYQIIQRLILKEDWYTFWYNLKFYHGLPDTREELVALLDAHD